MKLLYSQLQFAGKYCGILAALVVLWRLAAFGGMHLRVAFL